MIVSNLENVEVNPQNGTTQVDDFVHKYLSTCTLTATNFDLGTPMTSPNEHQHGVWYLNDPLTEGEKWTKKRYSPNDSLMNI